MQTVTVKKDELLAKLKENRKNHRKVFEEAIVGYKEKVVGELRKHLERAKRGERVPHHIQLDTPMDQTPEYDKAITMLEMSIHDEIELTANEFECLVMDRWRWKKQFVASNSIYVTGAKERYGMALEDE